MALTIKGKYNVALNSQGFILQGVPDRPAYQTSQAPVYGTRFASGDRDYNDLSQWWYMIETDWSGGFKEDTSFLDDAMFYYSSNIDARTKPGSIRLEKSLTLSRDNNVAGNDDVWGISSLTWGSSLTTETVYESNNGLKFLSDGSKVYSSGEGTPYNHHTHRGYIWALGTVISISQSLTSIAATDITSYVNSLVTGNVSKAGACVSIGNTLYVFGYTTGDTIFCVKTTVAAPASSADFTLVFDIPAHNNLGGIVAGAALQGSQIVFLVTGQPNYGLYSLDIASGIPSLIYNFDNTTTDTEIVKGNRYCVPFYDGSVLVTVINEMSTINTALPVYGSIWKYSGGTLTKIYETTDAKKAFAPTSYEALGYILGGATVLGTNAYWGNLVYDGTHFFNFIKTVDDNLSDLVMVIGTDGNKLYMADTKILGSDNFTQIYVYNPVGTSYKTGASHTAFLVFSQHDKLQSIDKLLHNINIGFDKMLTGQSIEVYYSLLPSPTPAIADWTSLGTASYSVDGGSTTFKLLQFPDGVIAKKVWFRVNLVGGGSDTPSLFDFTLEYLPIPDYRRDWILNFNCAEGIYKLDGQPVKRTGREMSSFLEQIWLTKSVFQYQDIDYAETTLTADITSSATTIAASSTADFPEYGRLVIGSEEMFYTSKTPNSFKGVTRGVQGTVAAAHTATTAVYTGLYKALATNFQRTIPILQKDKQIESVVQLQFRETGV